MTIIGAQGFTLRAEFASLGPAEVLRRVSSIGYRAVELSGFAITDEVMAEIAGVLGDIEIDIATMSVDPREFDDLFGRIPDDAATLGCSRLRIGALPFEALESAETLDRFCASLDDAATRLGEQGLTLHYHNHDFDFARYDGRSVLDRIVEQAPSVGIEFDVHWAHRGGHDPVKALQHYADRIDLVHLKDLSIGRIDPALIRSLHESTGDDLAAARAEVSKRAHNSVLYAEVGEGTLDFASIIPAAVAAGADYLFVEQDQTYDRTPFESLALSYENIRGLGFADLL